MKIRVLSSMLGLWQTFRNGFMKLEHTERWPQKVSMRSEGWRPNRKESCSLEGSQDLGGKGLAIGGI